MVELPGPETTIVSGDGCGIPVQTADVRNSRRATLGHQHVSETG